MTHSAEEQNIHISKDKSADPRPIAVVLVSGGLDSATCLAIARQQGYDCHALSFDYGQRHRAELQAAEELAVVMQATEHKVIRIDMNAIGGSALTDSSIDVPNHSSTAKGADAVEEQIPVTYVPARNTVFLSFALGWAEVLGAQDIFIGVNAVDYSGYPDCRPEFIQSFETMAGLATKAGVEGKPLTIHTPLISLTKAQIIQQGVGLGVDYSITVSCYQAGSNGAACGVCDSCVLRKRGFEEACMPDPTVYR